MPPLNVNNRLPARIAMTSLAATLVLAIAGAGRATTRDDENRPIVIDDVTIIDVERGNAIASQTVRIVGERIVRIEPARDAAIPDGARVIPGKGLYLMPGLFDAHVHFTTSPETFAPLLLAHGVTAVRDTGAPTDAITRLREQSRTPGAKLPHIICTGAIIDGDPPVWPFSEPCDTPEEARDAVRRLRQAGVDQIKVYSLLKPEVYRAAIDEAHSQGLKAVGHVPNSVSLDEAIDAGQDCMEHLMGFEKMLVELSGKPADDRSGVWSGFSGWLRYGEIDKAALHERLKAIAARERVPMQCPTIVVMAGIGAAADPETANADERMARVPTAVRAFWSKETYREFGRFTQRVVPHMVELVGELHRAGVPLMIGTDLANPYVFAGSSVHEEMKHFHDAGIPAADVLRCATIIPAKFCGVDKDLGSIAPEKIASLVLLSANPLDDVSNVSQIRGVFVRGVHYDRAALDKMLDEVREHVSSTTPAKAAAVDMNLPGELVRRGRYAMKFNGQFDAGAEDFVITRDKGGFYVRAHSQPLGGFSAPAVVDYHIDPNFKFVKAEWKQLTQNPVHATYELKDGTLIATAMEGDAVLQPQEFKMPENGIVTAPVSACDFTLYRGVNLDVDETGEFQAVGFGFPGWQVSAVPMTITRRADEEFEMADGTKVAAARHYFAKVQIPQMGEMNTEVWTDEKGVLLKSTTRAAFGTIDVMLMPAEAATPTPAVDEQGG